MPAQGSTDPTGATAFPVTGYTIAPSRAFFVFDLSRCLDFRRRENPMRVVVKAAFSANTVAKEFLEQLQAIRAELSSMFEPMKEQTKARSDYRQAGQTENTQPPSQ